MFVVVVMGTCFFLYLDRMLDELQRSISPQRKTVPPKVEAAAAKDSPVYASSVHHQSSSKSVRTSSGTANQHLAEQAVAQTSVARRLFDTSAVSEQASSSTRVTRSKSPEPLHPIEPYNVRIQVTCSLLIDLCIIPKSN